MGKNGLRLSSLCFMRCICQLSVWAWRGVRPEPDTLLLLCDCRKDYTEWAI